MVKLRLQRYGTKKRPYYRLVATASTSPRDGRFIEIIGTYHPIDKENQVKIDEEKALKWLEMVLNQLIQLNLYLLKWVLLKSLLKIISR